MDRAGLPSPLPLPLPRPASHTARGLLPSFPSLLDCCLRSCFSQFRPQHEQCVSSPVSTWRCQAQLYPQAQGTHLRVRVMARSWCGDHDQTRQQAGGRPGLQSSKEWRPLPSWSRRRFLLGSALWRRYEKPGIQGSKARSGRNVRPPGSKFQDQENSRRLPKTASKMLA